MFTDKIISYYVEYIKWSEKFTFCLFCLIFQIRNGLFIVCRLSSVFSPIKVSEVPVRLSSKQMNNFDVLIHHMLSRESNSRNSRQWSMMESVSQLHFSSMTCIIMTYIVMTYIIMTYIIMTSYQPSQDESVYLNFPNG